MKTDVPAPNMEHDHASNESTEKFWRKFVHAMGPGLVTGASDDDPSGIATYAQAGAKFGGALLWTAFLTFPLMASVQEISDRTALATGQGLGELASKLLSRWWKPVLWMLMIALIAANTLNITADLVAVGAGMRLLHAGPAWIWSFVSGISISVLLITGSFPIIARIFKILTLALLSYVVVIFFVHPHWGAVARDTLIPHFVKSKEYAAILVAVLGTTISPYLFFWQSGHRVEDMREEDEGGDKPLALKARSRKHAGVKQRAARIDVFTGMLFSNVVMLAIILATGQTLALHGHPDIASPEQAASALAPLAGRGATLLFALGFIGSGMLAIPVLAGSGAIGVSGLLKKKWGFSQSFKDAWVFYALVFVGTIGGMLMTVFHVNAIKLLVYVAVINGVAAAPFIVLLMFISSNKRIMGQYRNGWVANILGWGSALLMAAAAVVMFASGGLTF